MISTQQLNAALESITEANTDQLAEIVHAALKAHGNFGREVSEKVLALVQDDPSDPYAREALAQLEAVEGVLDGRLESL